MDEEQGFISKMKRVFRRPPGEHGDLLPLHGQENGRRDDAADRGMTPMPPARPSIFRPWAKRDAQLAAQQRLIGELTGMMGAIKDHLERQGHRNDELIGHLSHLPRVMDLIPETSRVQAETLAAVQQELQGQNAAQRQLASILERIGQTGGEQRQVLDALRERMEVLNEHDSVIADNLTGFGAAMATVSRNSQASAQVLEQLRDGMSGRDSQVEKILTAQNSRYTVLLIVTLALSVASICTTGVIAYLLYSRMPAGAGPGLLPVPTPVVSPAAAAGPSATPATSRPG